MNPGQGIGATYEQIWKAFSAKHGGTPHNREIHRKWKNIAARIKV